MPALTNSRLRSPRGRTEADGTRRWPWRSRKKLRKASRTAVALVGGGSDDSGRQLGPRHEGDLRMARRSPPTAAATDAAILTQGGDFTGSKGTAGIEGTKHKDILESEGCCANTTSSGQRVSPSSSAVLGPSVSELPGPCRASAHLDLAPDLDLKASSSHSGHSSETSLPEVQKNNYHEEFSLLKLQTSALDIPRQP
uniref:Spermatogenesis associated serine rich 1 n=1 Tax=Molossus molossus TaxID=27622 RepID=A0A7J8GT55_MOLMO|nr:spermatogenesis associated serine rich 1 [Molossus molossus]